MGQRFIDCLDYHAEDRPDAIAYRFIANDIERSQTLTFSELRSKAKTLAAHLQQQIEPNERAVLIYMPGLEFVVAFIACLYAGIIAVPSYTIAARRLALDFQRLDLLIKDSHAKAILTDSQTAPLLSFPDLVSIVTDKALDKFPETERPLADNPIAYLQYSSGSTGNPKGVMVTNENLIVNTRECVRFLGLTQHSKVLSWVPHYHDMGLAGFILTPLTLGISASLMSPFSFVEDPLRWFRAISMYKITHTGGPNFGFELCTKWIKRFPQTGMDLSCLKVALCGAEPINPELPHRFYENFAPYGIQPDVFYPVYGLAEHTLIASGGKRKNATVKSFDYSKLQSHQASESPTGIKIVSCGYPCEGHEIRIVDPSTKEILKDDQLGEIWLRGPSVTKGYWEKPQETQDVFQAQTADQQKPFLRSGDLGFFHEGQLYIFGRIKDIIIIRGRKYAPQDIEFIVQNAHESIRKGNVVAFSVDIDSVERLVIVSEILEGKTKEEYDRMYSEITKQISTAFQLAVYEIVLIPSKTLPKTTSGKVQRHICKKQYLNQELKTVGSWKTPALGDKPAQVQTPKSLGEWGINDD